MANTTDLTFEMFEGTGNPNISTKNHTQYLSDVSSVSPLIYWVRAILFACLAILTLVVNILSIVVLKQMHRINEVTRLLLIALNTTDIVYVVIVLFPLVTFSVAGGNWTKSSFFCILQVILYSGILIVDLFTLVLINGERYIACTRPLRYEAIVTLKRVKIIFLLGVICGLSYIIIMTSFVYHQYLVEPNFVHFDDRYSMCVNRIVSVPTAKIAFSRSVLLWFFIAIPITMVAVLLSRLLYIARKQSQLITREIALYGGNIHNRVARNNKGIYTFLLITVSLVIVWFPTAFVFYYEHVIGIQLPVYVVLISQCILCSFSWLNVLIYYWRTEEFKKTAKQIFRRQTMK